MAVRRAVHWLGEILITLGVVALLFVGYLVFWTNVQADARAQTLTNSLVRTWETRPHGTAGPTGKVDPGPVPMVAGQAFAVMRIPRLGAGWSSPVIAGVTLPDLAEGVGHYPGTAAPGQIGNFAVAGHRRTHGQPFADLQLLRPGDKVVVETATAVYVYQVDNDPNATIVLPTAVWVIEPVPGKPTVTPTSALITLTTCNPTWNSSHRMIVFGHLISTQVK
jgi:sortase A